MISLFHRHSIFTDLEYQAAQIMLQMQWTEFLDRFLDTYSSQTNNNVKPFSN